MEPEAKTAAKACAAAMLETARWLHARGRLLQDGTLAEAEARRRAAADALADAERALKVADDSGFGCSPLDLDVEDVEEARGAAAVGDELRAGRALCRSRKLVGDAPSLLALASHAVSPPFEVLAGALAAGLARGAARLAELAGDAEVARAARAFDEAASDVEAAEAWAEAAERAMTLALALAEMAGEDEGDPALARLAAVREVVGAAELARDADPARWREPLDAAVRAAREAAAAAALAAKEGEGR